MPRTVSHDPGHFLLNWVILSVFNNKDCPEQAGLDDTVCEVGISIASGKVTNFAHSVKSVKALFPSRLSAIYRLLVFAEPVVFPYTRHLSLGDHTY
ncbi:hypothetical protein [Dyadobacter pollutisoli]|uniref:Uncharacterized protein n=1 Tax=Dyadobacter pollutisoli TaxID=2910158 RepID=A0A9E8N5E9_9BACT|nr:hypothetical protein [Dyadobacter pollutisoli]WAC10100.1 hypothetical protein ON006_20350 [Dyadobacter pollutisoli]